MTGRWEKRGYAWCYITPDGASHATVYRADAGLGNAPPWLVYTHHTEGNDRFDTLEEAKAHGKRRLQDLLDATEALRGDPRALTDTEARLVCVALDGFVVPGYRHDIAQLRERLAAETPRNDSYVPRGVDWRPPQMGGDDD